MCAWTAPQVRAGQGRAAASPACCCAAWLLGTGAAPPPATHHHPAGPPAAVDARLATVDRFNHNDDVFAFLLSTRAGGQGLNLTGADTVILHGGCRPSSRGVAARCPQQLLLTHLLHQQRLQAAAELCGMLTAASLPPTRTPTPASRRRGLQPAD